MLQPTRLISTPFAQEGEKTEIQNVTGEFDNSATYRLGFPPITMQSIRLGGKPPKGTDFNGVLFDVTENISFLCKGGRYQYNAGLSTLIGGYPEGSNLLLDDNVTEVVSTVASNQNNPNINMTGWILKPNRTTAANVADASGETQQQVNYSGGSKWHSRVGGYQENERVVLTNGDIAKSTIDGNTTNPNINPAGWLNISRARRSFPSVLDNQKVIGDGLVDDSVALQEYFRSADDNLKSSIFFPLRDFNYLLQAPLVVQEPLMIYGDAAATYNRGDGKDGKIIIGASADYAFNLGNERTYAELPADRVLDVDLKKTRNPADQWTLKNLAFAQAEGIPAFTKTAIKHTAATDGPDRGFIMREVSAKGLKHVLHVTNQNKTTQLANLIIENCCLSECDLPVFAEGMVLGLRFVGNQSEQNINGSIKGTFSSGITIEDNMLEGQNNPFELVIPPITGNRPKISFKRNYLEANAGDFILKLRSSSSDSELELAENFLWTATTKDFVQIDDGARWSITNRENRAIAFLGASGVSKASSMFGNIKYYKQYFDKSVNYGASVYTAEFDNLQSRPSAVSAVLPTTAQVYDHPLYGKLHYEDRNNGYLTINQPFAAGDVIVINMLCSADTGADYTLQCFNANISTSLGELSVNLVNETKGEMTLLTFTLKVATASTALRIRLYSPSQTTGGRKIFGACAENMGAHVANSSKDIYPTLPKLTRYTAMNPAATQSDSTATDVAGLKTDFNALLAKLKTSGQMQ